MASALVVVTLLRKVSLDACSDGVNDVLGSPEASAVIGELLSHSPYHLNRTFNLGELDDLDEGKRGFDVDGAEVEAIGALTFEGST
jgi:hypothetical protein